MANHFYGYGVEEHYEKDIKDFTLADKMVAVLFFLMILATIILGFCGNWGFMIIMIGADLVMMDVMVRVLFHAKNFVMRIFSTIGILTIIAGILVKTGRISWVILYGIIVYFVFCFGAGILCIYLAIRKNKKIKEYSLNVEAVCEIVDEKVLNIFRYDDVMEHQINHSMNVNTIQKPAFHYYVNGMEYFTESTVYYGDLNSGFEEGQKVMLRVNPANPNEILPKNENSAMEMGMGISWLVIGVVCVVILAILGMLGELDMLWYL